MIDKTNFAKALKDKYVFENETFKREVRLRDTQYILMKLKHGIL